MLRQDTRTSPDNPADHGNDRRTAPRNPSRETKESARNNERIDPSRKQQCKHKIATQNAGACKTNRQSIAAANILHDSKSRARSCDVRSTLPA